MGYSAPAHITASSDRYAYLELLLRSIPSNQPRPELFPEFDMLDDELGSTPCTEVVADCKREGEDVGQVEVCRNASSGEEGLFAKLGAFFSRIANVMVKVEDPPATTDAQDTKMAEHTEYPEAEVVRLNSRQTTDSDADDRDDEIVVEYMIIAEKSTHVSAAPQAKRKNSSRRRRDRSSTAKQHYKSKRVMRLTTPPVITHRRRDLMSRRTPEKKKKPNKGSPGFK